MALHFRNEATPEQRDSLEAANTTVLIRAIEDSNDEHIEALNDLVSELMAYAGISDDGSVQPRHCDNCGEVELALSDRDLCPECDAEDGLKPCPNCGEYKEPSDIETFPTASGTVTMCGSCVHNARRSGWEPGYD